jgi:alpha-beta hydrolase superfamily lysophospholipase
MLGRQTETAGKPSLGKRIGKWTGLIFGGLLLAYLATASVLVLMKQSEPFASYPIGEDEWRRLQEAGGTHFESRMPHVRREFTARDGTKLAANVYGEPSPVRIVYLHGVNSDAGLLRNSAGLLQTATGAQIITPDARGHGASEGKRYDVDHIGQYEEDLADIVAELRRETPQAKIYAAGHSMGGGVATRFALLPDRPTVDGYILFAPNFGDGPTQHAAPANAGTESDPARKVVYFDKKPFIGTLMLNILGITAANDTPVLYFNRPQQTAAYTYDAVLSAQPTMPNDAPKALAAMKVPLLVLVGEKDEVFNAAAYPAFVAEHSRGKTIVMPGLTHNGLINDSAVAGKVADWLRAS